MTVCLPSPKPVAVVDGRVRVEAVEVNAARHCNISCRSCSHGSPSMLPGFADPEVVARDLGGLRPWMHVEHVRVLGGEPLIHPRLVELLEAVRRSGLVDRRRVLTNGLRLGEQPEEFWEQVEEVHVSVYPNTARHIARAKSAIVGAAQRSGTTLRFNHFTHFRSSFRQDDDRPELTQAIYDTCQIANRWRCITVDSGRLHRCPQAMLAHDAGAATADSLVIESIDDAETVRSWLLREDALSSCQRCAGSVGRRPMLNTPEPESTPVPGDQICRRRMFSVPARHVTVLGARDAPVVPT